MKKKGIFLILSTYGKTTKVIGYESGIGFIYDNIHDNGIGFFKDFFRCFFYKGGKIIIAGRNY